MKLAWLYWDEYGGEFGTGCWEFRDYNRTLRGKWKRIVYCEVEE